MTCTGDGGPAAEVPLDGTVYDLETGKVLVWCPKNNPLRFVLGSLKVCQPRFEDACQSHQAGLHMTGIRPCSCDERSETLVWCVSAM